MELWIRSQDKECLMKVSKLDLDNDKTGIFCYSYDDMNLIGKYKTKNRAIEILDEISNKIKNQFIVKANCLLKPSDMIKEKHFLEDTYNGDFIMQPPAYDIEPVNPNIVYYEMPTE